MAHKDFVLANGTPITIYKRRTSRHLRLSINGSGKVQVSIPLWAPYKAGLDFARTRERWIKEQLKPSVILESDQSIGKAHHLSFVFDGALSKVATRINGNAITIRVPSDLSMADPAVQAAASAASIRALRLEAEQLLPQRLARLASEHDFSYSSVSIKQLKRRWGSCDHRQNIVLNLFLMQLPWQCIDYVLLHELTHTQVLDHGPDFWARLTKALPTAKELRRQMRDYQALLKARPVDTGTADQSPIQT